MRIYSRNDGDQISNSTINGTPPSESGQKRKIRPTRRSVSGVYSFRGCEAIPFESTLERDFLIRTEYIKGVAQIISQPVQIPFTGSNGVTYTYTPDYLVYHHLVDRHYNNYPKPQLIEVKPTLQWKENWRKWSPKWKAALSLAKRNGWDFHIHDESRIRDQLFENVFFLQRFTRANYDDKEGDILLNTVGEMGSASMQYLLSKHYLGSDRCIGISHIWHLLATQRIACNMHTKLSETTIFWIPQDE